MQNNSLKPKTIERESKANTLVLRFALLVFNLAKR